MSEVHGDVGAGAVLGLVRRRAEVRQREDHAVAGAAVATDAVGMITGLPLARNIASCRLMYRN